MRTTRARIAAGSGDYLGEGHDPFVIENTHGVVVIGDYVGGQLHYTQVGGPWFGVELHI